MKGNFFEDKRTESERKRNLRENDNLRDSLQNSVKADSNTYNNIYQMNTRETDTVRIIHPDMIDYYNQQEQVKPNSCEDRSIEQNQDATEEALSDRYIESLYGKPYKGDDLIYSNDVINDANPDTNITKT